MVAFFKPNVTYKIFTQNELSELDISFKDNIILKLPISQVLKWIAFCRYGSFQLIKNKISFVPGIHNLKLYYPCNSTIPIFELANQFHMHEICDFHIFVTSVMKSHNQFMNFKIMSSNNQIIRSFKIKNENNCRIVKKIE